MEPHPIPQNVTTFQFKLVGDMTLKQFIYLATGSSIAYLLFVIFAPTYPLITWPLIILSASVGAAFAFLGIGSRSLDRWLLAFLKAVYTPTKRTWKKNGKTYQEEPLFQSRLVTYSTSLWPKLPTVSKIEPIPSKPPLPQPSPAPLTPPVLPTAEELQKTVDLAKQAQSLQIRIIQTERSLNQLRSEAQSKTVSPNYNAQAVKVFADLQNLVAQASQIKAQMEAVGGPKKEEPKEIVPVVKPKIKVVTTVKPKPTQLTLTTFPNVINGIIKDSGGNYLDGVVVVIYDKEGLPVRALKTNKLGQFTGSTPLPNGTYTLELEKDNFSFDVLEVELTGHLLPPFQIIAKEVGQS